MKTLIVLTIALVTVGQGIHQIMHNRKRQFVQTRRRYHHRKNRHTIASRQSPIPEQETAWKLEYLTQEQIDALAAGRKRRKADRQMDRILDLL